jgi:hypothetical protein
LCCYTESPQFSPYAFPCYLGHYFQISAAPIAYRIAYSISYGQYKYNSIAERIPFTPALIDGFLRASLIASPHDNVYPFLPTIVQDSNIQTIVGRGKIYTLNPSNATVSIRYCANLYTMSCTPIQKYVVIGQHSDPIAINDNTHIVYIGYPKSGTLSVINGFTDRVAVGAIFNVNPSDSGAIKCDGAIYPTNTYIYVDSGMRAATQARP